MRVRKKNVGFYKISAVPLKSLNFISSRSQKFGVCFDLTMDGPSAIIYQNEAVLVWPFLKLCYRKPEDIASSGAIPYGRLLGGLNLLPAATITL